MVTGPINLTTRIPSHIRRHEVWSIVFNRTHQCLMAEIGNMSVPTRVLLPTTANYKNYVFFCVCYNYFYCRSRSCMQSLRIFLDKLVATHMARFRWARASNGAKMVRVLIAFHFNYPIHQTGTQDCSAAKIGRIVIILRADLQYPLYIFNALVGRHTSRLMVSGYCYSWTSTVPGAEPSRCRCYSIRL